MLVKSPPTESLLHNRLTRQQPFFHHKSLPETVGAVCGVCRSDTGPSPVTFGAHTFHTPCANLYLHCVEPVLPKGAYTWARHAARRAARQDKQVRTHGRCNVESFDGLLNIVEDDLKPSTNFVRDCVSPEEKLVITLSSIKLSCDMTLSVGDVACVGCGSLTLWETGT
ncbi:hypothetical protein J6590_068754 [Homalodisca vitripennis]|nr:hypothetical protein J6590_068754 [Homalodisca vitripennis]